MSLDQLRGRLLSQLDPRAWRQGFDCYQDELDERACDRHYRKALADAARINATLREA